MLIDRAWELAKKTVCTVGARLHQDFFRNLTSINKKGRIDLVTEADLASEKQIIKMIVDVFPDHSILAEESGMSQAKEKKYLWIIDPLDGTTNFAHGIGLFSISIAFAIDDQIVVGVVYNPVTQELFSATKNQSSRLNDVPIMVSKTDRLEDSLLVTGFPYDLHEHFEPLIQKFRNGLYAAQGVRRLGSAALDLCYVAAGRFDGFWEENLKPWDTAAGLLIAQQAGARVTDFSNQPFTPYKNQILATNNKIHDQMLNMLKLTN